MYPHIDAIGNRAGELSFVALYRGVRAAAAGGAVFAAWARVERGDEHKIGGKGGRAACARDRYLRIFERLAQGIHDIAMKFGKFIEEKDPTMRERNFAGPGDRTAADE